MIPTNISSKLEQLTLLPPGWDGEDAQPINRSACLRTTALLEQTYSIGLHLLPFIAPLPDGGLMVEWKTSSRKELILEIPPAEKPIIFLLVEPTVSGQETGVEGKLGEDYSLDELIGRLKD